MMRPRFETVVIGGTAVALAAGLALAVGSCSPMPKQTDGVKKESAKSKELATNACITCHQSKGITGSALRDWRGSTHAKEGVGCADCHVPDESKSTSPSAKSTSPSAKSTTSCEDKRVRRAVSSGACADCHEDQVAQFKQGKHSKAWLAMSAMPTSADQPHAVVDGLKGCGGCHRIGKDEGKCDSCHTRHLFSAAEARRPEACATCHMGFDHPQWEMYSTSKHGAIYATQGHKWDWNRKLSELYGPKADPKVAARAPVCAACHMPAGDHGVRTAWGFLAVRLPEKDKEWLGYRLTILKGLGVLDADGKPTGRLDVVKAGDVARLTPEHWTKERERMVVVCKSCHSESVTREELAKADDMIKQSDKLMAEAVTIVQKLYDDRVLSRPKDYPASVDMLRFYEVETPIEQTLYEMFFKHRMRSFQGAFHMNPDYLHWYGWAQMKRDLREIRYEANKLRAEKKKK